MKDRLSRQAGRVDEYPRISPSSPGGIAFQVSGVVLNAICSLGGLIWLYRSGAWTEVPIWTLGGAVILGLFIADFVSGLLHWAFDTWFDEENWFFRDIVLIVREHHIRPKQIFEYRFSKEVGRSSWVALLLTGWGFIVALVAWPNGAGPAATLAVVMGLVVSAGVVMMYECHKHFGHNPRPGRLLRTLQAMHLVLSPKHHIAGHHRPNFDQDYCLINGWADRTLGALGVWRGLEKLVSVATGAEPRRNDREWLARYGAPALAKRVAAEQVR